MRTRTKNAMVAALLTTAVATGAGVGICLLKGNTDSAQAQTTHTYLAQSLTSAKTTDSIVANKQVFTKDGVVLTQDQETEVELTDVPAGQYCIKLTVTPKPGEKEEYFYVTVTAGNSTIYLNESANESGVFYGVINVSENETIYLNTTRAGGLTADISVETLFMNPGNGFNLSHVVIPAASTVSVDVQDSTVSAYTVMVDIGDQTLSEGATLTAKINDSEFDLNYNAAIEYTHLYSGTISLTAPATTKTLTITSTDTKALTEVTVTLMELSSVTQIENNTATAYNIGEWETAIFSYKPAESGYVSVAVTSPTTTVSSVEIDTSYALTAGTGSGTSIVDKNYPVYLEANTTYYFECLVTGITPVTGSEVTAVDLTINISDWQKPESIEIGSYALPVTPAEEISTKFALTGTFSLTIVDIPFNYYTTETPIVITAHIGGQAIQLTRDNNYSAVVDITADDTVYFTTSDSVYTTLTFSFEVYQEVHYIVPDATTATTITVPANGSITYFIEAARAGVYSVNLTAPSSSISVTASDITIIPAGKTTGGFVVQYEGNDFGITFVNSSDTDVQIAAKVTSEDRNATIELDSAKEITLNAGAREAYFMYGLAAGEFNVTISPAAGITLMVDGEPVTLTNGTATIKISDIQDTNGLVNFTFENTNTAQTKFTVTVTPSSSNTVKVGDTITIHTAGYEYRATYYAKVTAGESYALSLDVPEGMSVVVTQNGTDLILYNGHIGAFTAQTDGYVTLRFICYTYGNETELTAHFIESAAMPINTATKVDTAVMSTYVAYLYPGTYRIDIADIVGAETVKIAINSVEITGNSFEVYLYSGVTITFITEGNATFNATLIPNNMLTVDETQEITLTPYGSATYYIELTEGEYAIGLTLNGARVQVSLDGEVIVEYGYSNATFEITLVESETSRYFAITFETDSETEINFSVRIVER